MPATLIDGDEGAEFFAVGDAGDVAGLFQVEDDHRDLAFHAQRDRGHVHHAEVVAMTCCR